MCRNRSSPRSSGGRSYTHTRVRLIEWPPVIVIRGTGAATAPGGFRAQRRVCTWDLRRLQCRIEPPDALFRGIQIRKNLNAQSTQQQVRKSQGVLPGQVARDDRQSGATVHGKVADRHQAQSRDPSRKEQNQRERLPRRTSWMAFAEAAPRPIADLNSPRLAPEMKTTAFFWFLDKGL